MARQSPKMERDSYAIQGALSRLPSHPPPPAAPVLLPTLNWYLDAEILRVDVGVGRQFRGPLQTLSERKLNPVKCIGGCVGTGHISAWEADSAMASQGPLPLDKPDQLTPTFLEGKNGESAAWNVQGQAPSLPAPSVEPQPPAGPHHDTGATQEEPLRVSRGNLGNPWSSESGLLSLRQSSQGKCKESDTSLLSSGYAGDEENSEVSLVGNTPILRLPRRLHTQAGSAPRSQLCTIYAPSQIRSQVAGQARGSRQAGGEK
ncbi:protein TNT [Mirounga leonina]|uniref:protein TNT n=1 Tax=Mirounga leonina TaxID=9715 RepID=UPI00156BF301|nr:protein TNT [Mirounga leonina]